MLNVIPVVLELFLWWPLVLNFESHIHEKANMTVQILPFYSEGQELTSGCKQKNAQQSRNQTKQELEAEHFHMATWGKLQRVQLGNTFDLKPNI